MASIHRHGKGFSVRFRFEGVQHRVTVESERKAESVRLIVENTLTDLRLCRLTIPDGVDVAEFVASGGKAQGEKRSASLSDLIEDWKANRRAAETTLRIDSTRCKRLLEHFGDTRVDRLDVQGYVDSRAPHVSLKTIREELLILSGVLKRGRASGVACTAFSLGSLTLPPPKPQRRFTSLSNATNGRTVLLTAAEVKELRRIVRKRGSRLVADAVDLVAFTGMRRSEVCRIQTQDVDLKGRSIVVRELKRRYGTMTFRHVPIHPKLVSVLKGRLDTGEYVFTRSINTLTSGLCGAIEGTRFDIRGFGFHALRHSAASRLLSSGVSPVTVAAILGHASPATTLNLYAHAFDSDRRKAVNLL